MNEEASEAALTNRKQREMCQRLNGIHRLTFDTTTTTYTLSSIPHGLSFELLLNDN